MEDAAVSRAEEVGVRRERARTGGFWGFGIGLVSGLIVGVLLAPTGGPAGVPARWFSELTPFSKAQASVATPTGAVTASTAVAASIATAVAGVQPQLVAIAQKRPLTIGVFGDSMADGLWAGLYRQLKDGKNFDVVRFSQPSTGISRYDYVDVQSKTENQLAQRHVDIGVILFGTNDEQGIIQGKTVLAFNTPAWRQVYEARVDNLVGTLRRQGAAVYWVGLPKMERAGFDQRAAILNSIYAQRMATLGVPYIPTVAATSNEQGAYDAYLSVGGKRQLMRAKDGIHMTMSGYLRIASPVTQRLRGDLNLAAGHSQTASAPSAQASGARP